jgi:hyperosmotically inducible protein
VAFFLGYRIAGGRVTAPAPVAGTSGHTDRDARPERGGIDTERARERGAEIGQKAAEAGNRASEVLSDAALTTKIKSKMALDDTVKALDVHVSTTDGNVTLSGRVHSEQERHRVVALARETRGVKSVNDRLEIR